MIMKPLRAVLVGGFLALALASAQAQEVAPGHLAAARELVAITGISRSFDAMVPQMMDQLERTLKTTRPEIAKDLTATMKELTPEFAKGADEMLTTSARIVSKYMNEAEIKDSLTFFKSPAGKKYVEMQPQMLDQLVVAMQGWSEKLSAAMMTRVREEMKKKGHDI
ncbi:MAG: DUF2059 domain-containing protein [Rhizobiales bacterium]|nr:DUF2059 domain-containing protein [Hyphomicrobiales bacterium]